MKVLYELERLKQEYDKSFDKFEMLDAEHYREELSTLSYKTLPALIRVARAAEQVDKALARSLTSDYRKGERQLHDVAWPKLVKALKQLRELGETYEANSTSSQGATAQDNE